MPEPADTPRRHPAADHPRRPEPRTRTERVGDLVVTITYAEPARDLADKEAACQQVLRRVVARRKQSA